MVRRLIRSCRKECADAVKKHLADAGVNGERLTAKGLGMSKPLAKNNTEAGRARNRRVELVKRISGKKVRTLWQ